MADNVEMQDIRGLDIDKMVKGFALTNYIFKNMVTVSNTSADHVRWYQETASDLTATTPMRVANTAILATPAHLEVSWTRNTSYVKEYMAESTISEMDIMSSDIDVLARTLLRLTRSVVKQVDTDIYNVLTESQTPTSIGTSPAKGSGWDDITNGSPIADIMSGAMVIAQNDYDTSSGYVIAMTPKNHKDLLNFLIDTKGASIPTFSSEKVKTGVVMNILGGTVVVSNNVTADSVFVGLPATACTWKQHTAITSRVIEEPGLHRKIRVWERGIGLLTDPKASYLITDVDT